MTPSELEAIHQHLAQRLAGLDAEAARALLMRFALLAIDRIADATELRYLIDTAAEGHNGMP